MQTKLTEVEATLQAKIAELRREAREEVLSVLTTEQRTKLDALTGAEFEFPTANRQRNGRRRGAGGGRNSRPNRSADRPAGDDA